MLIGYTPIQNKKFGEKTAGKMLRKTTEWQETEDQCLKGLHAHLAWTPVQKHQIEKLMGHR